MSDRIPAEFLKKFSRSQRVTCPLCSPERKPQNRKKRDLNITVTSNEVLGYCHHCAAGGSSNEANPNRSQMAYGSGPKRRYNPGLGDVQRLARTW